MIKVFCDVDGCNKEITDKKDIFLIYISGKSEVDSLSSEDFGLNLGGYCVCRSCLRKKLSGWAHQAEIYENEYRRNEAAVKQKVMK